MSIEKIEKWAEKQTLTNREGELIVELIDNTIRRDRIESTIGYKIGQFIRYTDIEEVDHYMNDLTNRYRYKLTVPDEIREESKLYKKLAYEVVFISQQMSQLDRKADIVLTRLFNELATHYMRAEPGRGSNHYQLLSDAEEELSLIHI